MAKVTCSKGCGGIVQVPDTAFIEAMALDIPINFHHDICPTDDDAPKIPYRIQVVVLKNDERVAQMGEEVVGPDFKNVVEELGKALQRQWAKIIEMGDVIDEEVTDASG